MYENSLRMALESMTASLKPTGTSRSVVERALAKRRRSRRVVGTGAAAVAALGVISAVGAFNTVENEPGIKDAGIASAGSETDPTLLAEIEWQTSINAYKDRLISEAQQHTNFSGAEVRYADRAIIIYGTGQPEGNVVDLLNSPPEGTESRWVSVPYSEAQLTEASHQLAERLPSVVRVSFSGSNYSSLLVAVDQLPSSNDAMEELRRQASEITNIPVEFEEGDFINIG